MSRFPAPAPKKPGARPTKNIAGGDAFDRTPRLALASLVLTSLVEDTYYQSAPQQLENLASLVAQLTVEGDLRFAAKAAIYARREHGLRSITHALAALVADARTIAPEQRGDWGPRFFQRVVVRPDDMTEIAGCWLGRRGGPAKKTLPAAMKRGFARVLEGLSAHQLAKYDGTSTRTLTLRQLAHLVHPKGAPGTAVHALRGGTLKPADTWEVALTQAGQRAADEGEDLAAAKSTAWSTLLRDRKLGYLALLRNVRNLLEHACVHPEDRDMLFAQLVDVEAIARSRVLPLQFLAAYEAISASDVPHQRDALTVLETAMGLALSNVPVLEGATLVALDDSGSMMGCATRPWHKQPAVVGSLFAAALLARLPDADLVLFSDDARYVSFPRTASIMHVVSAVTAKLRGCGTNFHAVFHAARRPYARVIILSDQQGWMGRGSIAAARETYERQFGCRTHVYSWDLVGSTTSMFPEQRAYALAGLSDKAFDLLRQLETDPQATVHAIDAVQL